MTTQGMARTAAARAARTRTKHDRWIRELAGAGWTVIRAGNITVEASVLHPEYLSPEAYLQLWCGGCDRPVFELKDQMDVEAPLPKVLHAVTGHTCEGPK